MWLYVPSTSSPSAPVSEGLTSACTTLSDEQASALARSVTLRGKPSPSRLWSRAWKTGGWIRLLSGATSPPSILDRGVEQWIASLGGSRVSPGAGLASSGASPADVQARAKTDEPAKPTGASAFAADVAAAKQALSRLAELASKTPPAKQEKRDAASGAAEPTPVAESLAKLADSFRALSDTVKEQQQRLGRVEKQFGLPNSAAPAEHVSKASVEDVGWPLDLNKPKDRENVDKAVSFHDL